MPCSQKSSPRVSGFPTLPPPASARLEGLQALGGAGPGRPGHCSQTGGPHGGKQQTNKQTVLLLPELYKGEDLTSLGNDQL